MHVIYYRQLSKFDALDHVAIALPTQSIAVEKDDTIPTTKRRLTLDDLLVHLKHYNAGTRKGKPNLYFMFLLKHPADAIMGLRELLESHWELLDSSLTPLISGCVRIIGDEVREYACGHRATHPKYCRMQVSARHF